MSVKQRIDEMARAIEAYLLEEGFIDLGMHETADDENVRHLSAFLVGFQDSGRFERGEK